MKTPFVCDSIRTSFDFYIPSYWNGWERKFSKHNDTINIALDSIAQNSHNSDTAMNFNNWGRLHDQIQDIYINGIGYNDIVSVICIPLIIALFAFSFPFIFQMINHINDKYASKSISTIFNSSKIYKFFWIINSASIFYVLLFGILTLVWKDFILITQQQLINWIPWGG